ncbi:hypothetical protein [Variovorax sp. HJSM1_2]|uniref:hypothetical protein n=1 Tax=Variovorax sp. HJSM1_2 TaxID=3366263 RepID=UPI003BC3077F
MNFTPARVILGGLEGAGAAAKAGANSVAARDFKTAQRNKNFDAIPLNCLGTHLVMVHAAITVKAAQCTH